MKKDSADKKLHSIKRLNQIMGYVLLGTAFLMTFLFIDKNIKNNHWQIVVGVFGGLVLIEGIIWISLYFSFKKKNMTENDKKIEKAIDVINKEQSDTVDQRREELYKEASKDQPDIQEQEILDKKEEKPNKKK